MPKLLFVMNPVSGRKQSHRFMMDILRIFNDADFLPTVYMTRACGDARAYVAKNAAFYDRVVCCGGDGTFSETVGGLLEAGVDIPVAFLPGGSTNDLAKTLGIPTDIKKAAENAVSGTEYGLDIGLFGETALFSYVASFGLFTKASYSAPQDVKNNIGHLAYLLEGVKELSKVPDYRVKIEAGDQIFEDSFIFGAVTNSLSIGGVFHFPKDRVVLNDGLFEIMLIRRPMNLIELTALVGSLQDGSYKDPHILFLQSDRVIVHTDEPLAWTVDGEYGGETTEVVLQNLPARVRILLPEESAAERGAKE